jgi:hypothetical protein
MITPDRPLGFQVSALYPDHDTRLIGHFSTLVEAEEFADSMRQIDGGRSYSMGPEQSDSARPACQTKLPPRENSYLSVDAAACARPSPQVLDRSPARPDRRNQG